MLRLCFPHPPGYQSHTADDITVNDTHSLTLIGRL